MKIETDIPIPTFNLGGKSSKYINLDVGQSIFTMCKKSDINRLRNIAVNSCKAICKRQKLKRKFVSRTYPDGFRIWRVE